MGSVQTVNLVSKTVKLVGALFSMVYTFGKDIKN